VNLFYIGEEEIDGGVHVIRVGGDLDFNAAPQLKESIVRRFDGGGSQLIIDLSDASFIDSTGIGVIAGGLERANEAGGSLAVVCDEPNVVRIFEVVGLDGLIPLHRSREDAVSSFARAV
jgi:anti-sigma B factor antagonist